MLKTEKTELYCYKSMIFLVDVCIEKILEECIFDWKWWVKHYLGQSQRWNQKIIWYPACLKKSFENQSKILW